MKKITLLLLIFAVSVGYSQVNLEDYEGTTVTAGFEGLGSASVTSDPVNGSNTALEIITSSAGQSWQGAETIMQTNMINLTSDLTVSAEVYSTVATSILAKVEDKVNSTAPDSADSESHGGTGWETLTFTFNTGEDGSATANGDYSQIAFFPLWNGAGWDPPVDGLTIYVDDITAVAGAALGGPTCSDGIQNQGETGVDCGGPCSACVTPPSTPAPTPPARNAADVVSIFSDAYTPLTTLVYTDNGGSNMDTYNTNWCPGETTAVMVAGNEINQITGLGCEGIDWQGARFDATSFTHMHIDIYTASPTADKSFNFKFSNWNGGSAENNAISFSMTNGSDPALDTSGAWISVDLELDSKMPGLRNDLAQFVITSDLGTVWYDNLYLYKEATASVDDNNLLAFNAYPNPTQDSWTIKTNNVPMQAITVYDVLGKQVLSLSPENSEVEVNAANLKAGLYFAKIKTERGINSIKLIKD